MTCQKIPFESRAAVKTWVRFQNRAGDRTTGHPVKNGHAYECRKCGAWHWTSLSKAEARRKGLA